MNAYTHRLFHPELKAEVLLACLSPPSSNCGFPAPSSARIYLQRDMKYFYSDIIKCVLDISFPVNSEIK